MELTSRDRQKLNASALSISAAVLLLAVKAAVGFATNSVGILASALDSLLDVFSSSINYVSIRTAAKPADREHRFGHGKAESLAAFAQSLVIFASVAYLVAESVRRLFTAAPLQHLGWGFAVMAFSSLVTLALILRLRRVMLRTGSLALKAEYLHYMPDFLTNLAVLAGIAAIWAGGWTGLDPVLSLGISVYLAVSAGRLLKEAVDVLMDRELPKETLGRIHEVLAAFYPRVLSYHDLKTRRAGDGCFAEVHLEICERQSFRDAHDIAEEAAAALEKAVEGLKVTVHQDLCRNCLRCEALFERIAAASTAKGPEGGGP